jgi:N-acetylglucosaminyl-diphospho-decaprenol L-rhamnosyltransferase
MAKIRSAWACALDHPTTFTSSREEPTTARHRHVDSMQNDGMASNFQSGGARHSTALSRVTVICVTYNSAGRIAALAQTLNPFPLVTVVDNASSDRTVSEVRKAIPQASVIENKRNLGFGSANNLGIRQAATEFVMLLNPDCEIGVDAVEAMVDCADDHGAASLVAPQLLDRSGHVDVSYAWFPGSWNATGPRAQGPTCVGFASGACLLIRTSALRVIDGFDENFFLYYEDTDLCIRLHKQAGPLIVEPRAEARHINRGSSSGIWRLRAEYLRGYHHIQSKFMFEAKHFQTQPSIWRRLRYSLLAALEFTVRSALLDAPRAARVLGRVFGALRSQPRVPNVHRPR